MLASKLTQICLLISMVCGKEGYTLLLNNLKSICGKRAIFYCAGIRKPGSFNCQLSDLTN